MQLEGGCARSCPYHPADVWSAHGPPSVGMLEGSSVSVPKLAIPTRRRREWIAMVIGGGAALTIGAGSFLNGYYELSKWGPLSLVVLILLMVMLLTREGLPPLWTLVPALGLALLGAVDFVSATWTESTG